MAKPCLDTTPNVSGQSPRNRSLASHCAELPQWFAAYTFPKHESAVAERLASLAVEVFYPATLRRSKWKDRTMLVRRPLFPGYVFVRVPLGDRISVVKVPGVVRIVSGKGVPLAIPDSEIETVRLCLLAGAKVEPHPYVDAGTRVRLKSGPCRGIEGVVSHNANGGKLIVSVAAIHQAVALEVNASNLEPIDPDSLQC